MIIRIKKIIISVAVCGMIFVSGCGDSEKVIEREVQNIVIQEESVSTENAEQITEITSAENDKINHTDISTKGYVFTYQGTTIEIDADIALVIEKLGEPISYFEAPSCAFEGLDKIYTYNGFELDTYSDNDTDYISAIIFKDDSITTTEGISIGDTIERLEQAYGEEGTKEDGMVVYNKDGMKLCFILQDEEIISIEYRSTVLE